MNISFIIGVIGFLYSIFMIFNIKDLILKLASGLFALLFFYLFIIFRTSGYISNPSSNLERIVVTLFFLITNLSLISCFRNSKLWMIDKILFIIFIFLFFGLEILHPFLGGEYQNFRLERLLLFTTIIIFIYFLTNAIKSKKNRNILNFIGITLFIVLIFIFFGQELLWQDLGDENTTFQICRILGWTTIIIFIYFSINALLYKKNLDILKFLVLSICYYSYQIFTHVAYVNS